MAVGAAVVVAGAQRFGGLVTTENLDHFRPGNFGRQSFAHPLTAAGLAEEIGRYDPADATAVSQRIRAEADMEIAVDRWIALYGEVIAEATSSTPADSATAS